MICLDMQPWPQVSLVFQALKHDGCDLSNNPGAAVIPTHLKDAVYQLQYTEVAYFI